MKIVYAILGVMIMSAIGFVALPKGIKNNNAGNIRVTNDEWLGLSKRRSDGEFFIFDRPIYGLRALAKILINYEKLHKLKTIKEIIRRYAPSVENDTNAYINSVSLKTGFHENQVLDVVTVLPELMNAIIQHENGFNPYNIKTINQAVDMAIA